MSTHSLSEPPETCRATATGLMRVLLHIDTKMFSFVTQLLLLTLHCASSCATNRYSFGSYSHSTTVARSPHFQSHWVAHDAPLRNVDELDVIRNICCNCAYTENEV